MTSLSVRFLSLPLSSSSNKTRLHATTPAAAAPPAPAEVGAGRLEPRVEDRDGFWILKEKFRQGINPQEKVKLEKEPMKLFMENGIEELANLSMEEIDNNKVTKDDIDVRLKWLGLFHRRKHHCKFDTSILTLSIKNLKFFGLADSVPSHLVCLIEFF